MTRIGLTRHQGAIDWLKKHIQIDQWATHLHNPKQLQKGDEVYGVFPIHLAAQLNECGVRCFHLEFDIPEKLRGTELTEKMLTELNARLIEYNVTRREIENSR
jgi:CRISPR-associated protein Csx16